MTATPRVTATARGAWCSLGLVLCSTVLMVYVATVVVHVVQRLLR
jgi:hypothetical protein